jgi:pre-mRNA-splicing helicase BRR2
VNLPAHMVIVKGTQIYAPERGGLCELSSADVFQCFGRAGRPQYDTSGEAVLITEQATLQRYVRMRLGGAAKRTLRS